MKIAAVIVTRGDVDLSPILASLPREWDSVVYDNSGKITIRESSYPAPISHTVEIPHFFDGSPVPDVGVYGRYAAIEYTDAELIYVQDDDCVLSNPQAIVDEWHRQLSRESRGLAEFVVCNMPANFRARHFYDEHSLVGFGGAFHRDAPKRAFDRYWNFDFPEMRGEDGHFNLTCDMVFTGLTPRILVDIEYEDMPWASADNRMWRQPWHQKVRDEMLEKVLQVRAA